MQINCPDTPDLSKLSKEEAVDVLWGRATVLDVKTLSKEWQKKIATQEPGIVKGVSAVPCPDDFLRCCESVCYECCMFPYAFGLGWLAVCTNVVWPDSQLLVEGKFGMEEVVVCTSVAAGYDVNRDAFTESEHDWMMVEINLQYRREVQPVQEKEKNRVKIPFVCKYCDMDFVDKATLGLHRKMEYCECYCYRELGPLKIYPARGLSGNKIARAVFQKYKLPIPWQMLGKRPTQPKGKGKVKGGKGKKKQETASESESEGGEADGKFKVRTGKKGQKSAGESEGDVESSEEHIRRSKRKRSVVGEEVTGTVGAVGEARLGKGPTTRADGRRKGPKHGRGEGQGLVWRKNPMTKGELPRGKGECRRSSAIQEGDSAGGMWVLRGEEGGDRDWSSDGGGQSARKEDGSDDDDVGIGNGGDGGRGEEGGPARNDGGGDATGGEQGLIRTLMDPVAKRRLLGDELDDGPCLADVLNTLRQQKGTAEKPARGKGENKREKTTTVTKSVKGDCSAPTLATNGVSGEVGQRCPERGGVIHPLLKGGGSEQTKARQHPLKGAHWIRWGGTGGPAAG